MGYSIVIAIVILGALLCVGFLVVKLDIPLAETPTLLPPTPTPTLAETPILPGKPSVIHVSSSVWKEVIRDKFSYLRYVHL